MVKYGLYSTATLHNGANGGEQFSGDRAFLSS